MPVSIIRLRRWFAAGAILAGLLVLATYFHARRNQLDALKQVPERIGINIQQTAEGFTISKSEQGRTLFTLQANKAVQFKKSGQAELHEVTISLYGKDSSRFDRIYGSDFEYDAQSGNVTSKGEVSIDVQANPRGVTNPGQAAPKDPKNPIHLKTTDLVFNKNTGDAWTNAAVEFSVPQGSGSAVGARYEAKSSTLTLESKLKIDVHGSAAAKVSAERAILKKDPREILLSNVSGESDDRQAKADEIVISLREDNTLDHTVGTGNVTMRSSGRQPITANSQKIEVFMRQDGRVKNALLSGEVHLKTEGPRPAEAWAGRANLSFGLRNILKKVHADQQVRLIQIENGGESPSASANKRSPKNRDQGRETEIQAPAMDFVLSNRDRLRSAETSGPPEILITSASEKE